MATAGEDADEQTAQDARRLLMAPDAGCVEVFSPGSNRWKRKRLLARMDLRWISAKGEGGLPKDTKAWAGKGHSMALVRGHTEVIYKEGEREWAVKLGDVRQEFRAETAEIAAQWVAALRWRVRPWIDLLKGQSVASEGLGDLQERGPTGWPLRAHQLATAQSVVSVLDNAAGIVKDTLGPLPVVGPALSVLGFALEVAGRVKSDSDNLQPAQTRLARIAERTLETLQRVAQGQAESRFEEVSELLGVIEEGARQLESYEYQSTVQMMVHGVFKGRPGPSAVLDLASECEQRLSTYEQHDTNKAVHELPDQLASTCELLETRETIA
ncbi:unnamed protein product [Ostreobium quekettii]|uniref:Uncharacterized protein n=1 Tax=Ostreobium quekettii TaxID=121088 RepID=A0A8S1JB99_9CHLO|nr:unnamed protein product [Ostreobium quekettii]